MTGPPILILGTGAMACLFAARLRAAGRQVVMLGSWPEGLRALRQEGVRLVEEGGERCFPVLATEDPARVQGSRLALVLVKAWQTARAAEQLAGCLSPEGVALTLQNGLGNLERIREALGPERAALGVTTVGATLLGPGRVQPGGEGEVVVARHPRLGPLVAALQEAGFEVRQTEEVEGLVWGKLVVNTAINPLTALLGVPNGALLKSPAARALMADVARETAAVAAARGAALPYPDPVATVEAVARRTAPNRSSMLQDVLRGAPTEIDVLNGAVAREAAGAGMEAPLNRTLWRLVRALVEVRAGGEA